MPNSTPSARSVELWIRSFQPATTEAGDRAVERARSLEDRGPLESVRIGSWGKVVRREPRVGSVPQVRAVNERLDAFETWADRADRSIEPYFRTKRIDSTFTQEDYTVCHLPTVALAEYVDGKLVHVAPCRDGERPVEVEDRLDALAAGDPTDPVTAADLGDELRLEGGEDARSRRERGNGGTFLGPVETGEPRELDEATDRSLESAPGQN